MSSPALGGRFNIRQQVSLAQVNIDAFRDYQKLVGEA
jgi:hypothetical protein